MQGNDAPYCQNEEALEADSQHAGPEQGDVKTLPECESAMPQCNWEASPNLLTVETSVLGSADNRLNKMHAVDVEGKVLKEEQTCDTKVLLLFRTPSYKPL